MIRGTHTGNGLKRGITELKRVAFEAKANSPEHGQLGTVCSASVRKQLIGVVESC